VHGGQPRQRTRRFYRKAGKQGPGVQDVYGETGLSPVSLGDAIAEPTQCPMATGNASISGHRRLPLQKMHHHKHVLALSRFAVGG
jgi:hypothetical protein